MAQSALRLRRPDGTVLDIPALPCDLGREAGCGILLDDRQVSRRHARLEGDPVDPAAWRVTDLGSSNGTYVNGHRIQAPTALHPGDQLRVGSSVWCLEALPTPAATGPAASPAPPPGPPTPTPPERGGPQGSPGTTTAPPAPPRHGPGAFPRPIPADRGGGPALSRPVTPPPPPPPPPPPDLLSGSLPPPPTAPPPKGPQPEAPPGPAGTPPARHRWWVAVGAALLLVVISLAWSRWTGRQPENGPRPGPIFDLASKPVAAGATDQVEAWHDRITVALPAGSVAGSGTLVIGGLTAPTGPLPPGATELASASLRLEGPASLTGPVAVAFRFDPALVAPAPGASAPAIVGCCWDENLGMWLAAPLPWMPRAESPWCWPATSRSGACSTSAKAT